MFRIPGGLPGLKGQSVTSAKKSAVHLVNVWTVCRFSPFSSPPPLNYIATSCLESIDYCAYIFFQERLSDKGQQGQQFYFQVHLELHTRLKEVSVCPLLYKTQYNSSCPPALKLVANGASQMLVAIWAKQSLALFLCLCCNAKIVACALDVSYCTAEEGQCFSAFCHACKTKWCKMLIPFFF